MSEDDRWQKREDEIYRQERAKLDAIEKERAFLKDKSIAGPRALRPSDKFIDQSLGKPLGPMERGQEAGRRAEKQIAQEKAAEARKQAERKQAQKQREEKSAEKPRRKLSEIMKDKRQQARGRTHKRGR